VRILSCPFFPAAGAPLSHPTESRPRGGQPNRCAQRLLPLAQRALAQVLTGGVGWPPPATGQVRLTAACCRRVVARAILAAAPRLPLPWLVVAWSRHA